MSDPNKDEEQLADAPAQDVVERLKEKVREEQARKDK